MAATWDEIRQLQADLASVQKSESSQKLSERNCVEIVNHLIASDLLEVLFTLDGKEYVTPQRLEREIRDELHAHGGRINVVELQSVSVRASYATIHTTHCLTCAEKNLCPLCDYVPALMRWCVVGWCVSVVGPQRRPVPDRGTSGRAGQA